MELEHPALFVQAAFFGPLTLHIAGCRVGDSCPKRRAYITVNATNVVLDPSQR